jgi:hypothetical protein
MFVAREDDWGASYVDVFVELAFLKLLMSTYFQRRTNAFKSTIQCGWVVVVKILADWAAGVRVWGNL